jgi:phosphopantothenoylcysteine decarboxylase/phosphopantothenate--cysteine ligase
MAAAVADYGPAEPSAGKLKRSGPRTLDLVPNEDILALLGEHKNGRFLVGFALEVESCMANAEAKLQAKRADLIVLNNPMQAGSEFGGDTNQITLLEPTGPPEALPLLSKREAAERILARVAERMGPG